MKTLTPAAVNRALDKINAKPQKNPRAKRTAAQWKAEIAKIETMVKNADNRAAYDAARWLYDEAQDEYTKSANAAQMKLRKIMEDLNESRYGNPARKTRAVRVVAAKNPTKSSDVPGDFSQSSAKVYGRAWVDAKSAAVKDFGDVTQVKLIWSDGEWLQMLFDNKTAAINHLKRLGFSVNK